MVIKMQIGKFNVDGGLFEQYCYSIICVHRSPTKNCDQVRRVFHDRILKSINVERSNTEFCDELDHVVFAMIGDKITPKY